MKICHVNKFEYPSFGEIAFGQYSKHIAELGLDVTVLCCGKPPDKIEEVINNVKVKRIIIHNKLLSTFIFLKEVSKIIREEKFDIVHTYSFRGAGILPLLCYKKRGKWLLDIRTGSVRGGIISNLANFTTKLESFSFDAISTVDKNLTKRIFGESNKENFYMFPVGVDLDLFKKKNYNVINDKFCFAPSEKIIINCGSISKLRKLHIVIEGFNNVLKKEQTLKLMFIGDGPDTPRLKTIVRNLGISNKIIFTGSIKYENLSSYLNAGDIAVSFVPINKEFDIQPPKKTIDYLACGLPTIATDTKGNRRFIKDRHNGLLIKDDAKSLEKAIIELLDNHELRNTITKNSRISIAEFDWRNIVKKRILPAYRSLLKN